MSIHNDTLEAELPVDLSDYKTAHGAAKKTYKTLQAIAQDMGQDPDEVTFYTPEETRRYRNMHGDVDCYTVAWEGGPYEWAPSLTGGDSIYTGEFGFSGTPEIVGLLDGDGWGVECYYSFDLQFFNE